VMVAFIHNPFLTNTYTISDFFNITRQSVMMMMMMFTSMKLQYMDYNKLFST
jgi:hypothetical protein